MAQPLQHRQTPFIARISTTCAADFYAPTVPSRWSASYAVVSITLVRNICQAIATPGMPTLPDVRKVPPRLVAMRPNTVGDGWTRTGRRRHDGEPLPLIRTNLHIGVIAIWLVAIVPDGPRPRLVSCSTTAGGRPTAGRRRHGWDWPGVGGRDWEGRDSEHQARTDRLAKVGLYVRPRVSGEARQILVQRPIRPAPLRTSGRAPQSGAVAPWIAAHRSCRTA